MNGTPNIYFSCNFCGTTLCVPEIMAGVSGPCPKCGSRITAPIVPIPNKINRAPRSTPAPKMSALVGKYGSNQLTSANLPLAPLSVRVDPMPILTPTVLAPSAEMTSPVSYQQPYPIQNHYPPAPAPAPVKSNVTQPYSPFTNSQSIDDEKRILSVPKKKKRKALQNNVVMFMLFALTFVLILSVMVFLRKNRSSEKKSTEPPVINTPIAKSAVSNTSTPESILNEEGEEGEAEEGEGEELASYLPSAPSSISAEVEKILEKFLNAENINERKPYIQSNLPEESLKASVFNKKWPNPTYSPLAQHPYSELRLREYHFHVKFPVNARNFPSDALVVVQHRGSNQPKIDIDPLMDTINGGLKKYAESHLIEGSELVGIVDPDQDSAFYQEPLVKDQKDFYCIIQARPECFTLDVPNKEKKGAVKLLAYEDGQAIAFAYMSDKSPMYEMFSTQKNNLRWNKYIVCQVTLKWNVREDVKRPYIEIIRLKSLGWNR